MTRSGAASAAQALIVAMLLAMPSPTAGAAEREDGFLTAYAYSLFPSGARVRLDPRDDAADDMALMASFRRALERRGHMLDPSATLVLSFDLIQEDDVALADRPAAGDVGTSGEVMVVRVERPGDARNRLAASELARYRLSVSIDDRRTGRRVWSAELLFAADYRGHVVAAQAMVPVLLDTVGQTVNRLSITFE